MRRRLLLCLAAVALLVTSCAVTSSDGAFSVVVPSGWQQSVTPVSGTDTVLELFGSTTSGIQEHFLVTVNSTYQSMADAASYLDSVADSSQAFGAPQLGALIPISLGGEPAYEAEYQASTGPEIGVATQEFLVVDHGSTTYLAAFSSDGPQFAQQWSAVAQPLLKSWKWTA